VRRPDRFRPCRGRPRAASPLVRLRPAKGTGSPAGRPHASYAQPGAPYPKSQFFSQSFESILPTSLTYIIPSTRGCAPWRPAAVMGTTGRENDTAPSDFQGSWGAHRTPQRRGALPAVRPSLRLTRFHGSRLSRKGENSPRGPLRRLRVRLRCRPPSASRRRNLDRLPFR